MSETTDTSVRPTNNPFTPTTMLDTRHLSVHDMKKLVKVFRKYPAHDAPYDVRAKYWKKTRERVASLPQRLRCRSAVMSNSGSCSDHKGLNEHLVNDIWKWVRYELQDRIGPFLYPLIVTGLLDKKTELKVRQLEPVLEMWHPQYSLDTSAPPGHAPIDCGNKWMPQHDGCEACMLARIGSDEKVLMALFVGMLGHFHTRNMGAADALRMAIGLHKKSKRIRFVRYWLSATKNGNKLLGKAVELGTELKFKRRVWKLEQRRSIDEHLGGYSNISSPYQVRIEHELLFPLLPIARPGFKGSSIQRTPTSGIFPKDVEMDQSWASAQLFSERGHQDRRKAPSTPAMDLSEPYQYQDWSSYKPRHDSKLGPMPRPDSAKQSVSCERLGFDMAHLRDSIDEVGKGTSASGSQSTRRVASIYVAASMYSKSPEPAHRPASTYAASSMYSQSTGHGSKDKLVPNPLQPRHAQQTAKSAPETITDFVFDRVKTPVRHQENNDGSRLNPRAASIHPSPNPTILSYDGPGASVVGRLRGPVKDPLDSSIYNEIREQDIDGWTRRHAAKDNNKTQPRIADADVHDRFDDDASALPHPKPASIYHGFGVGQAKDNSAAVDEHIPHEEDPDDAAELERDLSDIVERLRRRRGSDAGTVWSGLY